MFARGRRLMMPRVPTGTRSMFVAPMFTPMMTGGWGGAPFEPFKSNKEKLKEAVINYEFDLIQKAMPLDSKTLTDLNQVNTMYNESFQDAHKSKVTDNLNDMILEAFLGGICGTISIVFGGTSYYALTINMSGFELFYGALFGSISLVMLPVSLWQWSDAIRYGKRCYRFRRMTAAQNKEWFERMKRLLSDPIH